MKNKKLLAILLIASGGFTFYSCKDDTPSNTITSSQVPNSTPIESTTPIEKKVNLYLHVDPTDDYSSIVEPTQYFLEDDGNGNMVSKPLISDPEDDYRRFEGWYLDSNLTNKYDANIGINEDTHLYAKWEEKLVDAEFRLYVDDENLTAGVLESDYICNAYKIKAGAEIRSRNKTIKQLDGSSITYVNGFKNAEIEIDIDNDTTVYIFGDNGSSTGASSILVKNEDGTTQTLTWGAGVATSGGMFSFKAKPGKYTLTKSSGTIDIFDIQFKCQVALAPIKGIDVTNEGITALIEGQAYSTTGLTGAILYENNTSSELNMSNTNVTIDKSKVDVSKPGTYPVTVKYDVKETLFDKEYSNSYSDTFNVTIYELESLKLGFNKTVSSKNSYNTIYVNETVQRVYLSNSEYSSNALTVTALANNIETNDKRTFILPSSDYVNDYETSFLKQGNKKTIGISYTTNNKTVSASYDVYVVTAPLSIVSNIAQVAVDKEYNGEIGAVVEGYNMFNSIQQAIDFLKLNNESSYSEITLKLAAGPYKEKIEIDLANLTIVGEDKETTKIEWDSLYGEIDEFGYVQVTDSTATLAIRENAENFRISNVTISNWYNSTANFQEKFGIGNHKEHRALAMIVQADKFIMDNCKLLGYQDTVQFMSGRQLVKNTLITGTTDFIFGTNNTTYFNNCEIRSIYTEDSYKAGGYITAFKGSNKGEGDCVLYGAIFDGCRFTAEEKVYTKGQPTYDEFGNIILNNGVEVLANDGKTAIARPWGKYAAVAVINSELGGHISTTGYDGVSSRNLRYVSMSGNSPTESTIKFVEYNNTGLGAINQAVAGCKILSLEESKNYSNLKVIFASSNGNVTYADLWAGDLDKDAIVNIKNEQGETLITGKFYKDMSLSSDEWNEFVSKIEVPENHRIDKFYNDLQFTAVFSLENKLSETNDVYVKFKDISNLKTVVYNEVMQVGIDKWEVTNTNGSTKLGPDIGTTTANATIPCDKILYGGYLISETLSPTKEAKIVIIGGTEKTSKSLDILIEALDENGDIVASVIGKTSSNKTTNYFTNGSDEFFTISSTNNFVKIRISTTTEDAHFAILSVEIEYE